MGMVMKAKIGEKTLSRVYYFHRSPSEQKKAFGEDLEQLRDEDYPDAEIGETVIEGTPPNLSF